MEPLISIKLLLPEANTLYYCLKGQGEQITQEIDRVLSQLAEIDLGKTAVEDFQEIVKSLMEIKDLGESVTRRTEDAKKVLDGLERIKKELTTPVNP